MFSEVCPKVSIVPNSTSPSEEDDDSVADKHYNSDKDADVLEDDDQQSNDPEEISPLVKRVQTHVKAASERFQNSITRRGK